MRGLKQEQKKKQLEKDQLDEILKANHASAQSKLLRVQQEKEEEEKIIAYQKEKARKEAEYEAEQKRLKEEKELQVAKLREQQEKANDRQAEIDALRAKRAFEKADRETREKERRDMELRVKFPHILSLTQSNFDNYRPKGTKS
jgi:Trichohyalin-plectin-homology domain